MPTINNLNAILIRDLDKKFSPINAIMGKPGRGIVSIERNSGDGTAGSTDVYTISYSDGTTSTFEIYNGSDGESGADGVTPHIGDNGNWWIGETDTGIRAQGPKGNPGENGTTPHIGENGNWYIGETDTGIQAKASGDYIPLPATASADQIVAVQAVDEYGTVTETKAIPMPEEVYILGDGETLDDVPEGTKVVFDPNEEGTTERIRTYVTPQMFGAKGDGVTDDTAAIQAMINSGVPNIVIPNKSYLVDGIHLKSNIKIHGFGTFLVEGYSGEGNGNTCAIYADGISNVEIEGVKFEITTRVTYAMTILNSENISLRNIVINGNAWNDDGTVKTNGLVNGITFTGCKDIIVNHVIFDGTNAGGGLWLENCEVAKIENCKITHTSRGGIYIYNGNKNCLVVNNTLDYNMLNFTVSDGAIDLYGNNDNITVINNRVSNYGNATVSGCGIRIKSGSNNSAIDNKIDVSNEYSFAAILVQERNDDISSVSILQNTITLQADGKTLYFMRFDAPSVVMSGANVKNNVFRSLKTTYNANEVISLRTKMKNITIEGNSFFTDEEYDNTVSKVFIRTYELTDSYIENLVICNNILVGGIISLNSVDVAVVCGNIMKHAISSNRPIMLSNCSNAVIKNNIAKTTRTDIDDIVYDDGRNTQIVKENILINITT